MTLLLAPLLAAMLLGAGQERGATGQATEFAEASVTVRQRVIVRVPLPPSAVAPPPIRHWREKKGPRCIRLNSIAGATIISDEAVDLIFKGGLRLRARLENACPALDYYGGFYLRQGADGRVCAGRNAIHARSGGECGIQRFRLLLPASGR